MPKTLWLLAALASAPVMGCGAVHRQLKFFAPEDMVVPPAEGAAWVEVGLERDGVLRPAVPEPMRDRDGNPFLRSVVFTDRDTLVLSSVTDEPLELRLYTRGNGLFGRHDFNRVHTVSGSLKRRFPNEIVFFPEHLEEPVRVSVADLSNPYNNYGFKHGDLLLVGLTRDGQRQHLLFEKRATGMHYSLSAGVLATIPISDPEQSVAPILAFGPVLGWRTDKPSGPALVFDTTEVVLSFGIGSTSLTDALGAEEGIDGQLSGLFDATLAGGGLRFFRVITVQGFVNVHRFFRSRDEAPATLAVGVDARGLVSATRDIAAKLFGDNAVREKP